MLALTLVYDEVERPLRTSMYKFELHLIISAPASVDSSPFLVQIMRLQAPVNLAKDETGPLDRARGFEEENTYL